MRVLIVDDSRAMRVILKNQLSGLGIKDILEAEDGEDALEKLRDNMPIDLVTLDINMPIMDGMACLKQIRSRDQYKEVKIVMVTSESEKERVIDAISAGATNYVVKPFTPDVLKQKLSLG